MSGSAPNVNSIVLVGQLVTDPVLRQTSDGRSVCDLRLAVNDHRDQPPLFIDAATFGAGADACAEHLVKGRRVAVTGRLAHHEWQAKDDSKRSKHHVTGQVHFGGRDSADDGAAGAMHRDE
jgi:single-strand DNA-binding protein